MKSTQYKNFIKTLPVDTRTIVEYAISIFKDLETKKIIISKKDDTNFTKFSTLTEIDKAFLAIFISLLTVSNEAKVVFGQNGVNRDTVLEFLEKSNEKVVIPLSISQLSEEEKEKIYCSRFYFLNTILNDENIKTETLTPEMLAYLILNNNEITSIFDIFYNQTYKNIEKAQEHESFKELSKRFLQIYKVPLKMPEKISQESKEDRETLDEYGINISMQDNLHPSIGRENELRNIQIALKTPSKRGVILVGEPGVGKRNIVEGLALKIKNKDVPIGLQNKEIIEIDLATLIAGTSYRGQFEERVKKILNEAKNNSNIILFIDGIQNGISGEENNKLDFVSMLSGYLARGEISVIATTTKDAYTNIFLPNEIISSRLWKISIEEPSLEIVEQILYECLDELIEKTGVSFPNDNERKSFLIKSIVEITSKEKRGYFAYGNNPDLARGILERTFAIASINDHNEVEEIDLVEALQTDETLSKDARERQAAKIRATIPFEKKQEADNIVPIQLLQKKHR